MIVIGKLAQILRHLGSTGADYIGRQVARGDPEVKAQPHRSGADGGQQGVNQRMGEDAAGVFFAA